MRALIFAPFLILIACTDAPSDAPKSVTGTTGNAAESVTTTATADSSTFDEEAETQRADQAIAAVLEAEPELVFVGDWNCGDSAPSFEYVSFGRIGESGTYSAFLHDRPAGDGSWTFDDGTLTLNGSDGQTTFTNASVSNTTLTLTDEQGATFTCENVPISP